MKVTVWDIGIDDPAHGSHIYIPKASAPSYIIQAHMNPPNAFDAFNEPDYYDLCPRTQVGEILGSDAYTTLRPDCSNRYHLFH